MLGGRDLNSGFCQIIGQRAHGPGNACIRLPAHEGNVPELGVHNPIVADP